MARRDTNQLSDVFPWSGLTAPGSIFPQTIQAPQGNPGNGSGDDLGGVRPWGCDQTEPGPQDQV
jgi:hypothetical protein